MTITRMLKPIPLQNSGSSLHLCASPCSASTLRKFSTSPIHNQYLVTSNATFYPYGVPTSDPENSLFRDLSWSVPADSRESWAVLGPRASAFVDTTLLGRSRCEPTDARSWPKLGNLEPEAGIKKVSFKSRLNPGAGTLGTGGGFTDYTSRYFGIRQEDAKTLRQELHDFAKMATTNDSSSSSVNPEELIEDLARRLNLYDLLNLPLITLSNGQTRRARIARALLVKPHLLVLEEPFTGLDASSRLSIADLLHNFHSSLDPAIVLTLRPQDGIPNWITHIVETNTSNRVSYAGRRSAWTPSISMSSDASAARKMQGGSHKQTSTEGNPTVATMKDVNVTYGDRQVLKNINLDIREGDRLALKGHNGSGKTTLLAMFLGDHPLSYTQDLTLFGKPRDKIPTYEINLNIGHTSPELFSSFPRRFGPQGLTAKDVIGTGFEHIFTYRKLTPQQRQQLDDLIKTFGHPAFMRPGFLDYLFAELSTNDQSMTLLLRALVKHPKILVLDEPFAGMDSETIEISRRFLDTKLGGNQALVIISHFEEELPESINRILKLNGGSVVENS